MFFVLQYRVVTTTAHYTFEKENPSRSENQVFGFVRLCSLL